MGPQGIHLYLLIFEARLWVYSCSLLCYMPEIFNNNLQEKRNERISMKQLTLGTVLLNKLMYI